MTCTYTKLIFRWQIQKPQNASTSRVSGLCFAYRDPTRAIIFFWVDVKEKAMSGLWGFGHVSEIKMPIRQ
jgi:hypothetical protein